MSSNIRGSLIGVGAAEVLNMATIDSFLTNQMNLGAQQGVHETSWDLWRVQMVPPMSKLIYFYWRSMATPIPLFLPPQDVSRAVCSCWGWKGSGLGCTWGKISYQAQDQFLGCLRLAMQAVSLLRCTKSLKSSALANAPSYCYSKGLCVQGI